MPPTKTVPIPSTSVPTVCARGCRRQLIAFALSGLVLTLLFGAFLTDLLRFAVGSTLYSHIPLIPAVAAWLVWIRREELPSPSAPSLIPAALSAAVGVALMAVYVTARVGGRPFGTETGLALTTGAFVAFIHASAAWLLGRRLHRAALLPLAFLVFMLPIPAGVMNVVETLLQHGSAAVARALFGLSGTSMYYEALTFQLPGISLQVAPECSGIHSTLALLMVSLIAGHLFLRSGFRAALLAVAIVPLALLRNGFRIYVIGELCIHRGPQMVDSPIHHQGGPLFFSLSLIPFAALLYVLVKRDRRASASVRA